MGPETWLSAAVTGLDLAEREVGNSFMIKGRGKQNGSIWVLTRRSNQLARLNYHLYHTTGALETTTVALMFCN